ncbi:hypothetical protein J3R83DRAFT_7101 [Lanmaoa asiatica]|nr:hypothetical protein J3R83DRAFT_7101 [Lanmaoa asiatica]
MHQLLGNPNFTKKMNLQPFCEYSVSGDMHQYHDFMAGDWTWQQAIHLYRDYIL